MAYFPYVTFVSVVSFNDIRFVSCIVPKFVRISSKHLRVFIGSLRQSSEIFGHLRKCSENVRKRSSGVRNNFGKSSESFGRWSEIFGKSSKMPSSACLYNKKNITRRLEDIENKIHVFAPPCNILYIFFDKCDRSFVSRTAITLNFKMLWFPNEARY